MLRRLCVRRLMWIAVVFLLASMSITSADDPNRWPAERAQAWYDAQPWPVGANYVPRTAINQLEMWQADAFDPETIDQEFGWAADAGFNCMRVFLHDLLWQQDAEGLTKRIDQYLDIADRHHIKTLFVLFDSVWDPHPHLGPQRAPAPGVHNSGWVQGPHVDILKAPERHIELKPYVIGILSRYKDDPRILGWDLLNEPGNRAQPYWDSDPENKVELCTIFLDEIFDWAREVNTSQPLTAGVWDGPGSHTDPVRPLDQLMLDRSDVISFHAYMPLRGTTRVVEWLQSYGRPILCTEYMARPISTFQTILPYFHDQRVGAINWGLVSGKSQTIYPWGSWAKPFTKEPDPWFHDVFRPDGTPYDPAETTLIRDLTKPR